MGTMPRLIALVLLTVVALTGCSAKSAENTAAAGSPAATSALTTASPPPTSSDLAAERAAFASCLRENGVVLPESVPGGETARSAASFDPETLRRAMQTCLAAVPQFADKALGALTDADRQRLRDFVACLRVAGFDLPDPDFSSVGALLQGFATTSLDPTDPLLRTTIAKCAKRAGWDLPATWLAGATATS